MNKRWMILGSTVLALVLLTAGYAASGIHGRMGKHGKDFVKEHVLSKMDYTMQELGLTPAQQTKYSAIRTKMSASIDTLIQKHEAARESLKADWDRPDPDVKALAGKIKKEIQTMPMGLSTQIDYVVEVYDILDAKQQKQLVSMLKDHFKRKRGRWHDRDHGDDDDF